MALRRISRSKDGFRLRLDPWERQLLRSLPAQLKAVLDSDDPARDRLFPPAYRDDDDANAEYARLVQGDLADGKRAAVDVLEATVDATRLDPDQLACWLGALNDLRLVLGSRLGVTEQTYDAEPDPDDPRRPALVLYGYLSALEDDVVRALSSRL